MKWKVRIPGSGTGSPIVWGERVFVVTAIPAGGTAAESAPDRSRGEERRGRRGRGSGGSLTAQKFTVLCLDRASGKTLWDNVVVESTPHEGHHRDHGFASASPCTDGEHVYSHFGSRGLFCHTLAGKLKWKRTDFGKMRTRRGFGEGSSPTLHENLVIVPWDHEGPSYITALDKRTGKTRWRIERDEPSCWATPLIVEHDGKKQVITSGENFARGYDLSTGKELWRCSGQTGRPVASPVSGHGLVFIGSGFRGSFLGAFRLDGQGDIEGSKSVAWTLGKYTPDVPSPALSGKRLYFHSGRSGILSCHDAVSGKPHYSASRVEGLRSVYASPVVAAGRVYLTDRDGTTVVIEDSDQLKILATNSVDEPVDATPAVAGKQLFIRGSRHMFCIAE